jgi:hypothetical protein
MNRYDRGYGGGAGNRGPDWARPNGDIRGGRYRRGPGADRPLVGGYREGYQGGSGGIRTRGARQAPYARDYWWMGARGARGGGYDQAYRGFDRANQPQYSPVAGTYAAMGGQYRYNRPPRQLRDDHWFSDWTRWF